MAQPPAFKNASEAFECGDFAEARRLFREIGASDVQQSFKDKANERYQLLKVDPVGFRFGFVALAIYIGAWLISV